MNQSNFLDIYDELSLVFEELINIEEGKNKNKSSKGNNQASEADDKKRARVEEILRQNGLVPINTVLPVPYSVSPSGWTFMIAENRAEGLDDALHNAKMFYEKKLRPFMDLIQVNGQMKDRFEIKKIKNNMQPIWELDFGATANNQYRGLGFMITNFGCKYYVISDIFMKKYQAIDSGDSNVKQANTLYTNVMRKIERL